MPRKKGQQLVVNLPDGDEEEEDKSVTEKEVEEALERVDSEAPTKIESRIFRRHPATGNREQITDTVDSDAVTADFLRQQYGGGYYRIVVVGPMKGKAGKMGRGILRQQRFEIDVSIPPKHPAQMLQPAPTPNAERDGSALDAAVATMLTSMIQQSSQMAAAQMQAQQTMQTMQMQMMKDHSQMLAAQLEALRPKPEKDPLEVLEAAAKIIRPNEGGGFGEFIKQYTAFKELMGDRDDNETTWLDVVKEVAPTLIESARSKDQQGKATRGSRRSGVGAAPLALPAAESGADDKPSRPEHDTGLPNVVNPNLRFVAPIMPRIIKWAVQGKEPPLCAEWLLSDIPAGFVPMLREQLASSTFMADVVAAFPQAEPFQPWIDWLRRELIEQTTPEEEGEEEGEGEGEPE